MRSVFIRDRKEFVLDKEGKKMIINGKALTQEVSLSYLDLKPVDQGPHEYSRLAHYNEPIMKCKGLFVGQKYSIQMEILDAKITLIDNFKPKYSKASEPQDDEELIM